jgi:4-hydroxy-tetrahydrodipicolinate synthase
MSLKLEGVIAAVLLAQDAAQEIDARNLRHEARYILGAEVHGLLVNGFTGEGPLLTPEEAQRVCRIVVEEAAGQVPVVAGIWAGATRQAVQLGRMAREAGASALLVMPSYHVHVPTLAGIVDHYRTLGREVGLPLVVFNVMPQASFSPDFFREIAEVPEVIAIKHSNDDFHQMADLMRWVDGRLTVLSGIDDLLFPSLVLGARGLMAAVAGLLPAPCVEMYRAVRAGDLRRGRELHEQLLPVVRVVMADENYPANLKAAAELLGRPVGAPRSPLSPPSSTVREKILRTLQEAGFLTVS